MNESSVKVIAAKVIRPDAYISVLVNCSDRTVRPTTHLYFIEDGVTQIKTSLLVSADALFEHVAYTLDGQLYCSGHDGYVMTTDPALASRVNQGDDVSMYESDEPNPWQTQWYLRRICEEDIVLIGQAGDSVFFCSQSGQVIVHASDSEIRTFQIGTDALSFCARSEKEIYIGTERGEVWHFDGVRWRALPFVEAGVPRVWISAMTFGPDGQVLALSRNGFIAGKTANTDFAIMEAPTLHYNGADLMDNRLFISAREGLYEAKLSHQRMDLVLLKDTFAPLTLKAGQGELILTSATPRQKAYFVVARPAPDERQLTSCTAMSIDYKVES